MKKRMVLLAMLICMAFISINLVFAENVQPTQQYNKIFLNPFYTPSMTINTNYTFNVTINPPDGVSSVKSAIVTFDVWMTPTVTFQLWVNNKTCNNPTYIISTTFASAGRGVATFDCSNVITSVGTYIVTFKPTQANVGAGTSWLDLTYMNNPKGGLSLSGTEYSPNDPATIFTQLKDAQGNPITNGSCYLDVWYPSNISLVHPYTIQDAPMLQALGDDGIYYYDMVAPSTLGVYMLSAKCSYSFNWVWIYPEIENIFYPIEQINSGNWQGTSQVLNSRSDMSYERCDGSGVNPCSMNYTFNITTYGSISNITNINAYFSGEDDTAGRILIMAYWNGTGFSNLPNTLTWAGTSTTVPTGYDEFLTNSIPLNAIINGTVKLRLSTAGSVRVFYNWLSLALLTSSGTIQDVKGSSEMHITNKANVTVTATVNNTDIALEVWNSPNRTLTENISNIVIDAINQSSFTPEELADAFWNYNGTINSNILSQLAFAVWNYTSTVSNNILSSIWSYPDRNLTYYPEANQSEAINYTKVGDEVWDVHEGRYVHGEINN